MQQTTILWADDEIDLLKPHLLFLKEKGYDVTPVNSGADAVEHIQDQTYDLVFLDENMPGLSGLQTLTEIKSIRPTVPVVIGEALLTGASCFWCVDPAKQRRAGQRTSTPSSAATGGGR